MMGLCSISIQRKSYPSAASCAAVSALGTVMVAPITGFPSASIFLRGFSRAPGELAFSAGMRVLLVLERLLQNRAHRKSASPDGGLCKGGREVETIKFKSALRASSREYRARKKRGKGSADVLPGAAGA